MQKIAAYALLVAALSILLTSSVRIGFAMFSNNIDGVDFDVDVTEADDTTNDEPILAINQRKLAVARGTEGPEGVSDVLSRLLQMSAETRKIDESKLPYKCGAILYYHIPGTEGAVVNDWLMKLKDANGASYISSLEEVPQTKESFMNSVDAQLQGMVGSDWKIIYAQDNSISLSTDENVLRSWRDAVEKQQCQFIATTSFQDTMDHSVSHTKIKFADCNCSAEEFKNEKQYDMSDDPWRGQLDYLLFNSGDAMEMDTKEKVKRGLRLLKEHFDLVVINDHDRYSQTILRATGWSSPVSIPKRTFLNDGLVYSKDLVSKYTKLAAKNGDADFIDAVGHVYQNSLGYLMLQ